MFKRRIRRNTLSLLRPTALDKFSVRKTKYILSERLLLIAHETERSGKIGFGDFHTYDKDEALM